MTPDRAPLPVRSAWLAAGGIVAAVVLVYANSLRGPFVFDDTAAIVENPTIRRLDPGVLSPPAGTTVSGRPLLNLTFALNHALGGEDVRGYHALNIGLHALAALVLFGLLRRTFLQPRMPPALAAGATPLAFAAALLWAVHPLQTQAVTYLVQRAESLAGLCFLLTLYGFVRAGGRHRGWLAVSLVACGLGMAAKETMVSAPLAVLLYDRIFLAGSLREIWRERRGYYLALGATWGLLAFLAWHTDARAGTAGFAVGIGPFEYALGQGRAIVGYLRLAFWPHPLVFDYGEFERGAGPALLPFAALAAVLLAGGLWLWRRSPPAGFAVGVFLLGLAPTSSVLPILTEPVAEHRMYLPLAAVITLVAAGLHAAAGRRAVPVLLGLAVAAGAATVSRNRDYRSARALWTATVAAAPGNARAHASLATALTAEGDGVPAEEHFRAALALRPDHIAARQGLGWLLADEGRLDEAAGQFAAVLRTKPADFIAWNALGTIHFTQGRLDEAAHDFEQALQTDAASAPAHNNLGGVLVELGRLAAAESHLTAALRLDPDYAEAHYNLGNAQFRQGRPGEAQLSYEAALQLRPDYAAAHAHLGIVLQNLGVPAAAIRHYREALRLRPDYEFVRTNLRTLGADPTPAAR